MFKTPNEDEAKKWNKEFSSLEKPIDTLIAFKTPKGNIHKEIKNMADDLKITCSRLKRLDGERLKITNTLKKTAEPNFAVAGEGPKRTKDDRESR